jgi:hypothetical protein
VNSSVGITAALHNSDIDAVTTNFPLKAIELRQQLSNEGS